MKHCHYWDKKTEYLPCYSTRQIFPLAFLAKIFTFEFEDNHSTCVYFVCFLCLLTAPLVHTFLLLNLSDDKPDLHFRERLPGRMRKSSYISHRERFIESSSQH